MKDFQNTIQYYLLNHEKQKKYLAVVLALSMLVTFIVPLILTQSAESMTRNNVVVSMPLAQVAGNETLHPISCTDAGCTNAAHAYSEVDLLVGKNSELRGATIEETIRNANATYAIGIASQFCVFLDGDFTTTDADAEGRVAVSGSVDGANWDTWYYEIGNGDWYTRVGLDVLLNDTGYAHVISNGSNFKHVNVKSGAAAGDHPNWEVQNKHYSDANGNRGEIFKLLQIGTNTMAEGYNGTDFDHFYRTDTFSVAEQFGTTDNKGMLLQRSEKLSQNSSDGTITFGTTTDNNTAVKTAYLTYTGTDPNAESIFFNFTEEQWAEFVECTHVKYVNIPLLDEPREVVENDGTTSMWNTAYIVVNVPGKDVHIANPNTHKGQKFTSITPYGSSEEIFISRTGTQDDDYGANNHPGVGSLLYNFYEAEKLTIANNFQGTLLAPLAYATDEFTVMGTNDANYRGHLSGALIAKSFNGATEFGYRPYTGPISILGSTSGYTIPVDKLKTDGKTHLAGADFSLTITDESGSVVSSWKSGEDTEYVTIPTMIDFTGGETYTDTNKVQSRTYTVKEVNAPAGYIGTTKEYRLQVTETVDLNSMIAGEGNGTIPTEVDVEIIITPVEGNTEGGSTTLQFTISDEYSEDAQTMRKITIDGKQFWLLIDDQKVVGMVQPTGEMETSSYESEGTTNYTETIWTSTTKNHYYTKTDTVLTEVPVTLDGGETTLNENSEPIMTEVVATTGVDGVDENGNPVTVYSTVTQVVTGVVTETVVATDAESSAITVEGGSTVTEVRVVSSSALTDVSVEIGEFLSSYETSTDKIYIEYTDIPVTTSLVADTAVLASKGILNFGDTTETETRYYFDPNSLMLMPLPAENLQFINEYGFVFKKVDENGNPVTGATIALEKKLAEGVEDTSTENGNVANDGYEVVDSITASSLTIDPETLDANTLYRFRESVVPDGYEQAVPVYLVKFEDGRILYYASESEPAMPTGESHEGWTVFSLNAKDKDRVILMTDQKIHGYKLVLNKADAGTGNLLNGAYFELYAANKDLVYPKVNLYTDDASTTDVDESQQAGFRINGTLDLFEELKSAAENTYDSNYVEDGYLKKGTYYLEEVKPPGGYEKPSTPFRFKINYENGEYSLEILSSTDITPEYVTKEDGQSYASNEEFYYGEEYVGLKIIKIEVDVSNANGAGIQFKPVGDETKYQYNLSNNTNTFTPENLTFGDNGRMKITFWNCDITAIRYYLGEATGDTGGSSGTIDVPLKAVELEGKEYNSNDIYEYGSEYSNKKIYKIEIDVSRVSGAGIQFKPVDDQTKYQYDLSVGTNTFYPSDLSFGNNGRMKITHWNCDVTSIRYYVQSDETTTAPESTEPTESTTTVVGAVAPLETNESGELIIPNSQLGANIGLTVQKDWLGENGYEFARPSEIKVQLYQATSPEQVAAKQGKLYKEITLNAANSWTFTETVQRLIYPGTADTSIYYYYVEEINTPGYTVSYENNDGDSVKDGGIIHVKNELQTISLNVKKAWDAKGESTPSSVDVKLQYSADGETWTDVPNSTQTLTGSDWTYTYTDLPSNFFYKAVEVNVPRGWLSEDSSESKTDNDTLTITNTLQTDKLNLVKKWANGAPSSGSIKVRLYRSTVKQGAGSGGGNNATVTPTEPTNPSGEYDQTSDYSRLLQYSLYFYDANMCGTEVTEKSAVSWRSEANCHTSDNKDGVDYTGGFHDAGDHAMFGLPQGFTASTLGWSYYEFKDSFDSLGQTTHYKLIMDEFCDFFVKSTTIENGEVSKFLYQKGNGNTDHGYWGPPEDQSRGSDQMYVTSNSASDIAAEYAAALALHILNFPEDHPDVASGEDEYLKCAEALYRFSTRYNAIESNGPSGFYYEGNNGTYTDDQAWAAAWLYLVTNNNSYKQDCQTKLGQSSISSDRGHYWGNATLATAIVNAAYLGGSWDSVINFHGTWDANNNKISGKCGTTGYQVFNSWGSARHNALVQTTALITAKHIDGKSDVYSLLADGYRDWSKGQMKYILGDNSIASNGNSSTCFVTGFADNSSKYVHHRAASGYANGESRNDARYHSTNGHVLVGALVGGPNANGEYIDEMTGKDLIYQTNEVAVDYNAGLVGAAAGLYSVYGTGTLTDSLDDFPANSGIRILYPASTAATQQTLTLRSSTTSQQQSQKATSIKGISMVGSDVKAKAYTEVYTITNPDTDVVIPLSLSNISKIIVEVDFNGVGGYNSQLIYNTHNGYFAITGSYHEFTLQGVSDIENVKVTTPSGWNGFEAKITAIRFYTESSDPVFTISATIPNNRTEALLTDTVTLTPTNNAGNVTYTVKYADNSTETLTGNTFIPKKSGTVTITGNDGAANAETTITVSPMTISSITSTSLNIGETTTITLGNPGYGDITWTVSDDAVAKVTSSDNNSVVITALKSGTFTVTAKDSTPLNEKNSITSGSITVKGPSVTASTTTITEGQSCQITVIDISGNYTVTASAGELTGNSNPYTFKAPAVDTQTAVDIIVTMNGAEVARTQITVNPFAITQDRASVTEYGGTATLTANALATWTVQGGYSGNITLTPINGGMSCEVKGVAYTSDTITVTATDDKNNSDTAAITMQMSNTLELSIVENKTAIRIGDTVTLNAVPGNNVTYSYPTDKIQFDEATMQITALAEGQQVTITGTRNGATSSVILNIHPELTLTGDATMNAGETQTLQVTGNIGTLTWASDSEAVTVDQNGNVTAAENVENAEATITVTDAADGKTASFKITVKQSAVNANIPTGAQHIADIEITGSGDQWTENKVVKTYNGVTTLNLGDLPTTDGNGNTYYYYIEEILDGNETLVTGSAVYIPTKYENNGAVPSENGNTISVENTKISDVQSDGQMPSAGGEGTTWYYIAGAAMMLAGIAGYFVLKRKQTSER